MTYVENNLHTRIVCQDTFKLLMTKDILFRYYRGVYSAWDSQLKGRKSKIRGREKKEES